MRAVTSDWAVQPTSRRLAKTARAESGPRSELETFVPAELRLTHLRTDLPRIARDPGLTDQIAAAVQRVPTHHTLECGDARQARGLRPHSVHLALTSPPYWTLKRYRDHPGQLGHISDYHTFLDQLDAVWRRCFEALVPGGRLVCVVGDVCRSRRANGGRHTVVPLHAAIQEQCRAIGFDNLAPIIWHKIANARHEAAGKGAGCLGKPYEPNAVLKNDIEFVLMQRKPGGYRTPCPAQRVLSVIPATDHRRWFQQIWTGLPGASTPGHPAPYPLALAERLIRMFSFVGDTVLDPFVGTGTTSVAAARWGRDSRGLELDPSYFEQARWRLSSELSVVSGLATIEVLRGT
ncbi:MAG: site-specific DNA-methyltransferase [Verrucomicrobiales bacterium]|nr:site-specific DNA-methyltransferase [Verrucomicrobiales bacterium]